VRNIRQTDHYKRWFSKLKDPRAKARIDIRIRRLSLGNAGDVKPVGSGISELRLSYGPGYRVYFTQLDGEIIVLLAGGDKSSQSSDISKAKEIAANL
jgi:putative addiction module killer protein